MKLKLTLYQQAMLMIAVPVILQNAFLFQLTNLISQAESLSNYEYRAKRVIGEANWISTLLCSATLGCLGYVLTGENDYLKLYDDSRTSAVRELGQMLVLFRDNAEQARRVGEITAKSDKLFERLRNSKNIAEAGNKNGALALFTDGALRVEYDQLFMRRRELLASDRALVVSDRPALPTTLEATQQLARIGIIVNAVAALFLLYFFTRHIASRLKVLTDNSLRLAADQPLLPVAEGDDELSHLDMTFHRMARSLAEARRRENAIVANVADVICKIDSDGRLSEVSPAVTKSWGYQPSEIKGLRYIELVAADSKEYTLDVLKDAQTSTASFSFENQLLHKDKTNVDVLWSGQWSDDEQATFLVAHDITERKRVESMKQQFVGMVSHDLRTPLCGVQGFLELITGGMYPGLPEEAVSRARLAEKSVDRLIKLVNDLLDLEKVDSGAIVVHRAETDIASIFADAVAAVQAFADEKQVEIQSSPIEMPIIVDHDRIVQVIVNLLSNAVKFSRPGGVVHLAAQSSARQIAVVVSDSGRGIPEDQRAQIFERFHQVEATDGKAGYGTGLGLAICKAIVEQHGGSIEVESTIGEGSTFRVVLPV